MAPLIKDSERYDSWNSDDRDRMTGFFQDYSERFNLNDEQLAAVKTQERHLLVKAGAGTGKTSTIVARCAHLIREGVPPSSVLVLAFTRRAAQEVLERVESQIGPLAEGMQTLTFHSWCMQLIRGHEQAWGYAGWTVIDTDDQQTLFAVSRGERPRGFPRAAQIRNAYSFSRNTGVRLSTIAKDWFGMSEGEAREKLGPIARAYEERKTENRYLDYDDILAIIGKRLSDSASLAKWVGNSFPYILVDEMQDTNPIQWDILLPLVPHISLYAVGDDAQSIYGFRGASFEYIHHFQDVVEGASVLPLTKNYRSTQPILDLSNWLLRESPIDYAKELVAVRQGTDLPEMRDFRSRFAAASWTAREILRSEEAGVSLGEQLVLVRAAYQARPVESELLRLGIPYFFIGGAKLMESAHIRDVLAPLRVVANPLDQLGWMRLLQLYPGIGPVKAEAAMRTQLTNFNAYGELAHSQLPREIAELLLGVSDNQDNVREALKTVVQHLSTLLEKKYAKHNWKSRRSDFEALAQLAAGHTSILGFVEQYLIDPVMATELSPPTGDAVRVATIHSAKGMEAETVFIAGAGPGEYPSAKAVAEGEEEEERRVLYVAMTRARNRLVLTRTFRSNHVEGDGSPSYFLADVPEALWEHKSLPPLPKWVPPNRPPGADAPALDLSVEI